MQVAELSTSWLEATERYRARVSPVGPRVCGPEVEAMNALKLWHSYKQFPRGVA